MATFKQRKQAFATWKCSPLGELLGSGRYGKVFACGQSSAAKLIDLCGKRKQARLQAYREHVVALLQSVLLLAKVTPHFPWHYGATTTFVGDAHELQFTLYMERFDGTLEDLSPMVLQSAKDWAHAALQVLHACLSMAVHFGIVHNDLYPRNVLVRRSAPLALHYLVGAETYSLSLIHI